MNIPFSVISLKNFYKDPNVFSKELGDNFRKSGFCGIKDHEIDTDLVKEVQDLFIQFFSLPEETKKSYFIQSLAEQGVTHLSRLKLLKAPSMQI